MRKTVVLIAALAVGILCGSAATVTFDFAGNEFGLPTTTNTSDQTKWLTDPITKDGITITPYRGTAATGVLMYRSDYNNTLNLRFYMGSWFTITSTTGETIVSIDFETNGKFAVVATPEGEWTGDLYSTWVGAAASVRFDVTDKAQINKITVITEASTLSVAAPDFSPTYTELYEPTLITLSTLTEGADIYYTINGDNPNSSSTHYEAPFIIGADATIKAVAVKDGVTSEVSEETYIFPDYGVVGTVSEFLTDESEGVVMLNFPLKVVYQNGKYLYVTDGLGGYLQIYGELGQTYENGNIIPAGVVGTLNDYRGTLQMLPVAYTFKPSQGNTRVEPVVSNVSDFTAEYSNTYVVVMNAEVTKQKRGNYYDYYVSDETGTVIVFERFKGVELPEEGHYDVVGIANIFDETLQIYPISFLTPVTMGDVDGNGILDVNDVVALANAVMGDAPDGFIWRVANMDGSDIIDVTDVVELADIVMGK